jgi:hypothetical protein
VTHKFPQDYYKLKTPDRLLYLTGAPLTYIKKNVDPAKFSFVPVSSRQEKTPLVISPQSQSSLFQALHTDIAKVGGAALYGVGSAPTDAPAYEFLTYYCRLFLQHRYESKMIPKVKWVNLGTPDWDFLKSSEEKDIVVIHNITDESENKRWDLARDFISRNEGCTVFVLVNTPDILGSVQNKLRMTPDGVFQLGKTVHKTYS